MIFYFIIRRKLKTNMIHDFSVWLRTGGANLNLILIYLTNDNYIHQRIQIAIFLKGYKIECIGIPMHIDYFFDGGKKECTSESVREVDTYTS